MCGFCNVWVCVCMGFLMCECVNVWVLLGVDMCMCGCFDNCVGVLVIYVLVFCIVSFMYIYSYLLLV